MSSVVSLRHFEAFLSTSTCIDSKEPSSTMWCGKGAFGQSDTSSRGGGVQFSRQKPRENSKGGKNQETLSMPGNVTGATTRWEYPTKKWKNYSPSGSLIGERPPASYHLIMLLLCDVYIAIATSRLAFVSCQLLLFHQCILFHHKHRKILLQNFPILFIDLYNILPILIY